MASLTYKSTKCTSYNVALWNKTNLWKNIVIYSKPTITNFKRKDDSIIVCLYEISKVHVEAPRV